MIRLIPRVNSKSWQNIHIRTTCRRENAVQVVAWGIAYHRSPRIVSLRSKTLNSPIALTDQASERTHGVASTSPAFAAKLGATRFPIVTLGTGRSGENLRESNESEGQIHGSKCDGSHLV